MSLAKANQSMADGSLRTVQHWANSSLSEATVNFSIDFRDKVVPGAMEKDTSGTVRKLF